MKTILITIREDASVFDAAKKMAESGIGSLLVTDARNKIYGIVTDTDLVRRAIAAKKMDAKIKDLATAPLIGISPEADLSEAAKMMGAKKIKRLAVVKGKDVVGILSSRDIAELSPSLYDLVAEKAHTHG